MTPRGRRRRGRAAVLERLLRNLDRSPGFLVELEFLLWSQVRGSVQPGPAMLAYWEGLPAEHREALLAAYVLGGIEAAVELLCGLARGAP